MGVMRGGMAGMGLDWGKIVGVVRVCWSRRKISRHLKVLTYQQQETNTDQKT